MLRGHSQMTKNLRLFQEIRQKHIQVIELPIPDFLTSIFEEQLKYTNENIHNLIFTNNDSYIRTSAINEELKRIFKEELNVNSKDISTHCLRHTYGTRCIEAGMTAVVLQRLMGHKDVSVTLNTY